MKASFKYIGWLKGKDHMENEDIYDQLLTDSVAIRRELNEKHWVAIICCMSATS